MNKDDIEAQVRTPSFWGTQFYLLKNNTMSKRWSKKTYVEGRNFYIKFNSQEDPTTFLVRITPKNIDQVLVESGYLVGNSFKIKQKELVSLRVLRRFPVLRFLDDERSFIR